MATLTTAPALLKAILVPLEVYLDADYQPDCDWLDGELKERSMGESPHATIQGFIVGC